MQQLIHAALAQIDAPAVEVTAAPPDPWWHLLVEQAFAVTLLFIFLTAIVALIVNQRRRDKCLKLMHGYRATVLDTANQALWGSIRVLPKAMEVIFDKPYITRRGVVKSSALIYEPHLANLVALLRYGPGLDEDEQRRRLRQVRRTFRPNVLHRAKRSIRNVLNTLRDAFAKALSAVIGQLARTGQSATLAQQQSSVDQIGQTLLGAVGNAYEPLLERHIGRPVVLQLKSPLAGDAPAMDVPGYLADYTDKHVAVFNPVHRAEREYELTLEAGTELPGVSIVLEADRVEVRATGPGPVVVRRVEADGTAADVDAVVLQGSALRLPRSGPSAVKLSLAVAARVDVVCPRALATVLFGGEGDPLASSVAPGAAAERATRRDAGLAPAHVVASHSDEPVASA